LGHGGLTSVKGKLLYSHHFPLSYPAQVVVRYPRSGNLNLVQANLETEFCPQFLQDLA
jgi:hypothetical protein